jgi:hypothetical protein
MVTSFPFKKMSAVDFPTNIIVEAQTPPAVETGTVANLG